MLQSEDEDSDTIKERCALCRLGRNSLLGQGPLITCATSANNFSFHKRQPSSFRKLPNDNSEEFRKSDLLTERQIHSPSNHIRSRWKSKTSDSEDSVNDENPLDELSRIGFRSRPNPEELFDENGTLVVHHCCAAWSDGVHQDGKNEFQNLDKAVWNGSKQKCDFCHRYGASICCRDKKCLKFYHYPCAAAAGALHVFSSMTLLCYDHLNQAKASEVRCTICNQMGSTKDQVFCTVCGNYYHSKCLQNSIMSTPSLRAGWQCPDCKKCQVCLTETNGSKMLVCDTCDKGYHTFCLQPVITTLPKQSWKCDTCRQCIDCGSRTGASGPSSKWHMNYTLCDTCFTQRNKGVFCPVCCKAHASNIEVALLTCSLCMRAVHGACEFSTEALAPNSRSNYHCPYCRNEVDHNNVILTATQKEMIRNVMKAKPCFIDVDKVLSDDASSCLSTPTEMSGRSDDSTFGGKPDVIEIINSKPQSFLPVLNIAGKKKTASKYASDKVTKKKSKYSGTTNGPSKRANRITAFLSENGPIKEEEEESNYCAVVVYNMENEYVGDQDLCLGCGSFGVGIEGKLVACAQCGQSYHPYCANLTMSKEVLKKVVHTGWRCLDCTVCNSCGNANDEAQLLLCDDCDISYHTYCLDPPLDTVPVGGWKCKWCVHCTKCSSTSPGLNCQWLNNYTICGPCASSSMCPLCSTGYIEEDLLICCSTCTRWLHARCDNLNTEEEVEKETSRSYQCVMCRPKSKALPSEDKEYELDGIPLTESGFQQIKFLNTLHNSNRRRSARNNALMRGTKNKFLRTLSDKPHYCDDSDDEAASDLETLNDPYTSKRKFNKLNKASGGSFLPKPGKGKGKLMRSKSTSDRRVEGEPYDVTQAFAEMESSKSANQDSFFGKSLLDFGKREEFNFELANDEHIKIEDSRRGDNRVTDDIFPMEEELNVPVEDFFYEFLNNDFDIGALDDIATMNGPQADSASNARNLGKALPQNSGQENDSLHSQNAMLDQQNDLHRLQNHVDMKNIQVPSGNAVNQSTPSALPVSSGAQQNASEHSTPNHLDAAAAPQPIAGDGPTAAVAATTGHNNNLLDVGDLLDCQTGELDFDSLPQIDSQDVDDILAMDMERPDQAPKAPAEYPHPAMRPHYQGEIHQPVGLDRGNMFISMPWPAQIPGQQMPTGPGAGTGAGAPMSEMSSAEETAKKEKNLEIEENLGELAKHAAVLYCNKNFPNLKQEFPDYQARMKQINKLWRKAPQEEKNAIVAQAKENRNKLAKMEKDRKSRKSPSVSSKDNRSPVSKGPPSVPPMHAEPQPVEMVQQIAHQQQFIEQHIQQSGSVSTFPPPPSTDESPRQNYTPDRGMNNHDDSVGPRDTHSSPDMDNSKRASAPLSESYNSSPLADVNNQHSPASYQKSSPHIAPYSTPQAQRQLSFNAPGPGPGPNHDQSQMMASPNQMCSPTAATNPMLSPHAQGMHGPVYHRQFPMQQIRNPHMYSQPGYMVQNTNGHPQYFYHQQMPPRQYPPTWGRGEMMHPSGQWSGQMHYRPRAFVMNQSGMFPPGNYRGPVVNPQFQQHPRWAMAPRPANPASGYPPDMYHQQHIRMQQQHQYPPYPSQHAQGIPVSSRSPSFSGSNPSVPVKSPGSMSTPPTTPKERMGPPSVQPPNDSSNQMNAHNDKTNSLPVLTEADTFELEIFQPPSVQNETANIDEEPLTPQAAPERELADLPNLSAEEVLESVEFFDGADSNDALSGSASQSTHESGLLGKVHSESPGKQVQEKSVDGLDFDEMEASFAEALKERASGSSGPLKLAGQTLNPAAASAVADVVGELNANYKASNNLDSSGNSGSGKTAAPSASSSSSKNSSSGGTSSDGSRARSQSAGYSAQGSADSKSRLVKDQPLLIEDLLEQEKIEQKWHIQSNKPVSIPVVGSSSMPPQHSPRGSMMHQESPAPLTSPSYPHSQLLQRMAVSNRSNMAFPPAQSTVMMYPRPRFVYAPGYPPRYHPPSMAGAVTPGAVPAMHAALHTSPPMDHKMGMPVTSVNEQSVYPSMQHPIGEIEQTVPQPPRTEEQEKIIKRQKEVDTELEKCRKSKKKLLTAKRNANKNNTSFSEEEQKTIDDLGSKISVLQKESESNKKRMKEIENNLRVQEMNRNPAISPVVQPAPPPIGLQLISPTKSASHMPQPSSTMFSPNFQQPLSQETETSKFKFSRSESVDSMSLVANRDSNSPQRMNPSTSDVYSVFSENSNQSRSELEMPQDSLDSAFRNEEPSGKKKRLGNSEDVKRMKKIHQQGAINKSLPGYPIDSAGSSPTLKRLPELKPKEPELTIDWTSVNHKVPWSANPSGLSILSGEFGQAKLPGIIDYYNALFNREPLPPSNPPTPPISRSPSPLPCEDQKSGSSPTDVPAPQLNQSSNVSPLLPALRDLDEAASPEPEEDSQPIKLSWLARLDPTMRRLDTSSPPLPFPEPEASPQSSTDVQEKTLERLKTDQLLLGSGTFTSEVTIDVRSHGDLPALLRKISQILLITPVEDYIVKGFVKDRYSELYINTDCLSSPSGAISLSKRFPASSLPKQCNTCKTSLINNFLLKNLNEINPFGDRKHLYFCNNDCFLQYALAFKQGLSIDSFSRKRKGSSSGLGGGGGGEKQLRLDGPGPVYEAEEVQPLKLKLKAVGEKPTPPMKQWENIRWKRFKASATSTFTPSALVKTSLEDSLPNVAQPTLQQNSEQGENFNISQNDEIAKLLDQINVCVSLDPSLDNRRCILCQELGDGESNGPARLLNYDCDEWVHLNCALWSEEVYETINGALINVQDAVERSREVKCCHCGALGGTVSCHKSKCSYEYHFPCAVLAGCMFFKDKTVLCPQHKYRVKCESELENFEVFRRVYVSRDDHAIIAKIIEQSERKFTFRVGSMVLQQIGQLLPHQMNSFHNQNAIYPVGFKTTRFYWSMNNVFKRCKYLCSIEDLDGRPVFSVTTLEETPNPNLPAGTDVPKTFSGETSKIPWQNVMGFVDKLRTAANALKLFPEAGSGEEMFGLQDIQVLKILESFPGIECCKSYNFKFGRSPIVHLPLAINPSGSSRCEPKMRTYIKRPHVLTSKSSNSRSAIPSLACETVETAAYSKQFVHTKSSQYKRMKQEWRNLCHLGRSQIQGLGMYASKDIEKHTMIIEYIGLLIRSELAEVREKQYDRMNCGIYMFRLDDDWVIDATVHGGPARFINHSCEPNCQAELVVFDKGNDRKEKRIIITSIRKIAKGEELAYDYKIDFENDHKIPCNCGSANCRKWMN